MGKLWQRTINEQGKSQLQEVDLGNLRAEGPILVYLSGFLTNNNRPDYIAGGIKRMEELLKDRTSARPQIYAWSHKGLSNLFNLAIYNMFPGSRSSQAGYDLASAIVMPLVSSGFSRKPDGAVEGQPLPFETARKNLRNVTFFGYSAGSIVAQETFNASLKMMKAIGFKEEEARSALQEVVLLSAGTISRPSKERNRFSTVYLVASNDRINRFKNWVWGTSARRCAPCSAGMHGTRRTANSPCGRCPRRAFSFPLPSVRAYTSGNTTPRAIASRKRIFRRCTPNGRCAAATMSCRITSRRTTATTASRASPFIHW